MDEIVNKVVEKTGLSEEMAGKVVTVVLDFLIERLPAPLANQINSLLDPGKNGERDKLTKDLLGLFRRK